MNIQKYFLIVLIFFCSLIYCNNSNAQSWVEVNIGATGRIVEIIFVNSNTGYLVDKNDNAFKLFKTTNKGLNWIINYNGMYYVDLDFLNENSGFLFVGDKTLKTTNGGINWTFYDIGTLGSVFDMADSLSGYGASYNSKCIKTFDGGKSWVYFNANYFMHGLFEIKFFDNNTGVVSGYYVQPPYYGRFYVTTNGGFYWHLAESNTFPRNLAILNKDTGVFAGSKNVLITLTKGMGWHEIPITTRYFTAYGIDFIDSKTGFISGYVDNAGGIGFIYKSTNTGFTWTENYSNINRFISLAMADSLTVFAGTTSGGKLFKTTNGGLTPIENQSALNPDRFYLHQNYPNPFNPGTKIKFDIPATGEIKLVVYSNLGKEITVLLNKNLNPGIYEIEWNASDLSSGVYYYSLFINNNLFDTKKTVLIK